MLFILLLIAIVFSQQTNFMVFGINTNLSVIYSYENNCNFNSCPKIICDILNNTTSAYIALYPLEKIISCPKISSNFNVNMISFIFKENQQILFPFTCSTIGDCIMKSCNSYLSTKESFLMAFTGKCLS